MTAVAAPFPRWVDVEPQRLTLDQSDVAAVAPELVCNSNGEWFGPLPRWPFPRPEPAGLRMLLPEPLLVYAMPSPAHPLVEPAIYPVNVDIELIRRLDHRWHLSWDGRLCLTQGPLVWTPTDRLSDLLLKAAAWRCELALLEVGIVERMTERGIVSDTSRDFLFPLAAQMAGEAW